MSVRSRIEDARHLFSIGRPEGAFIQVLIAAAATSRKRYPRREWADGEAFKNFIYDETGLITGGPKYEVALPFKGKTVPLEDILYTHLRCQLLHEASLPDSIEFLESREDGATVLFLGTPLGFPIRWIETIAFAVQLAPENDDLWPMEIECRKLRRAELGELFHTESFCRRPGQMSEEMKLQIKQRSHPPRKAIAPVAELARQQKVAEKIRKHIAGHEGKLANAAFVAKAPSDVVAGIRETLAGLQKQLASVEEIIKDLAG